MQKKIGYIGLGNMGLIMSLNIVKKSGQPVYGFDISAERLKMFEDGGGIPIENVQYLLDNCGIIFINLNTNDLVRDNLQMLIEQGKPGTILVDNSSTFPGIIRTMYAKGREKDIRVMDAPVSGGMALATAGTLVIMCGGDQDVFDEVKPLLQCSAANVTYMGGSGNGSVTKLANNLISAGAWASAAEGFAFAVRAGLNPATLYEAIKDGYAGSAMMNVKIPRVLVRNFEPNARLATHQKDLRNAVEFAAEMGVELPITDMVLGYMDELEDAGLINEDNSNLAKVYEKRMGVIIKKAE